MLKIGMSVRLPRSRGVLELLLKAVLGKWEILAPVGSGGPPHEVFGRGRVPKNCSSSTPGTSKPQFWNSAGDLEVPLQGSNCTYWCFYLALCLGVL